MAVSPLPKISILRAIFRSCCKASRRTVRFTNWFHRVDLSMRKLLSHKLSGKELFLVRARAVAKNKLKQQPRSKPRNYGAGRKTRNWRRKIPTEPRRARRSRTTASGEMLERVKNVPGFRGPMETSRDRFGDKFFRAFDCLF